MINNSDQFNSLFQAVLEGFLDGILVVTEAREVIYANEKARTLCAKLSQASQGLIGPEVWRVCQALRDSRDLFPRSPMTLESEVKKLTDMVRIRVQWLNLERDDRPCMLVRLQDENTALQGLALAEAQEWGLTPREAEVWALRRAGYNRKQIAEELYIALDTVKKHLKNIQAKRQAALEEAEWQAHQAC
jgi:DNA-binding CsgD family transcriptional regulator